MFGLHFDLSLLSMGIRMTTPLLLAALGGSATQHANVFNIALEAMMLISAFAAVVGDYLLCSPWAGLLAAVGVGLAIGLVFAWFSVSLRVDVIVVGSVLNILAVGLTTFLLRSLFHVRTTFSSPRIAPMPSLHITVPGGISFLDALLSGHSLLTYIAWVLVFVLWFAYYRTPFGLHLRAAGEHPEALKTVGIVPERMKYYASAISGALCGMAGCHLALGYLSQFVENMTAGRGFIALAAVIFGQGNPLRILGATLLFGFADAIAIRLQQVGVPSYFPLMLPYVLTVLSLVFVSVRAMKRTNRHRQAGSCLKARSVSRASSGTE